MVTQQKKQPPKAGVLQLSKFYPPVPGGIETTVRDIASGLKERGWEVGVICSNTKMRTVVEDKGVFLIRVASICKIFSTSISPLLAWYVLKFSKRFEIIHIHLPDPMMTLALWITQPSCRVVVHWHSDIVKQKMLLRLILPLQKWILGRADVIVCTSEVYASHSPWLSSYIEKIRYVPSCIQDPNAIDFKIKNFDKIKNLKLKYRNKKIVFALGRLTYYKGFSVLIRAAANLPEDSIVIIGGDGDLGDALNEEARQNMVQDKIIFAGQISADDLPVYYSAADVFCLPSLLRSEAFGLVMVEAMSYGCPIVATNIPGSGVPWVNQNGVTGINVTPGDPKELASALTTLLNDRDYARKLGEDGWRRFQANFELSRMIDKVEFIYNQIGVTNKQKYDK